MVYYLVLIPMVYAALAIFLIGTVWQGVRIALGLRRSIADAVGPRRHPIRLGAAYDAFLPPHVLRDRPIRWIFSVTFHAVLLLIILGHAELVGEIGLFQIIRHEVPLGGGVLGVLLFAALLFLLARRFHSPLREISEPQDYYLLALLLLVVFCGSELHLARRLFDYSTISVPEYREYLSGILTFKPALPEMFTEDDVGHSFLLVLHVFFANLFLMLFPVSKLMHSLLAFPLARLRRG